MEVLLVQEDVALREGAMSDIYQRRVFDSSLVNSAFGLTFNTEDEEVKPRLYALGVISENIEEFKDPVTLLKTFLDYSDDDENTTQFILGGVVTSSFSKVVGPEKVFEEFLSLDPVKHWPVLYAMPMLFSLYGKWFEGNRKVHEYLDGLFRGEDYPVEIRDAALSAICKYLPYKDEIMTNAIRDAIEDDDPWIRGAGRHYWDCWLIKDSMVKSHQPRIEKEEAEE